MFLRLRLFTCLLMVIGISWVAGATAAQADSNGCAQWRSADTSPAMDHAMGSSDSTAMSHSMGWGDMPGMYMLDASIGPLPLVCLTENDPVPPPPYAGIGKATLRVPSGPGDTQNYFNQGLRFYYGFNNRESYRAFRYAVSQAPADAPCAICYVGEALALGVDINMPTELSPDRDAARKALADGTLALTIDIRNKKVTEHEALLSGTLLGALQLRFADCPPDTQNCQDKRNRDYEAAMEAALPLFPNDPDFTVLFADAVLNVWPWAYWNADGSPKGPAVTIAQRKLEDGMARFPDDEGLPHWYIHLMEMSGHPDLARKAADMLGTAAPNAGHLVHMPSHIYYRLGDTSDAIKVNLDAITQDEAYFKAEPKLGHPDGDRYRYGYYPHNIHFLLAAASLRGDATNVAYAARLLLASAPTTPSGDGFRADRYRSVYYLGRASFATSDEMRNFPKPLGKQPLALVAYDYAQLWAAVLDGRRDRALVAQTALETAARDYPAAAGVPSETCDATGPMPSDINVCLVAIMTKLASARIAALDGAWPAASAAALQAVAIQDRLPYDEPPPWLYPVRQTLAGLALGLRARQPSAISLQDLAQVRATLLKALPGAQPAGQPIGSGVFPGDGWTYYALWQLDLLLKLPADQDQAQYRATWSGAQPPDYGHM